MTHWKVERSPFIILATYREMSYCRPDPTNSANSSLVYRYVKKISGEGSEAEDQDRHAPLDI